MYVKISAIDNFEDASYLLLIHFANRKQAKLIIKMIYADDIQVSLKKDIEDMKHYKILINKLIEQLE